MGASAWPRFFSFSADYNLGGKLWGFVLLVLGPDYYRIFLFNRNYVHSKFVINPKYIQTKTVEEKLNFDDLYLKPQ